MQPTEPTIVALLIPAALYKSMIPVRISQRVESMHPLIGSNMVTRVPVRNFPNCGLWVDEDIMSHEDGSVPNLRASVLAGVGLYGAAILVSEHLGEFRSWDETNSLPFLPCVLQGFCEGVANTDAGRMLVMKMVEDIS
jgi:hypothetical protein